MGTTNLKFGKNFSSFPFVKAVKTDISEYSISEGEIVDIVLADVDLYLPTKSILEKFYNKLTPGGLILVDDVMTNSRWDGAHQAYYDFCKDNGIEPSVLGRKCAVIEKPT